MTVKFGKTFTKQYKKAPVKIRDAFIKRLHVFLKNPHESQLHNYSLTGEYTGFRSINVTGDWRAIYSEQEVKEGKHVIVFELFGTHSQLYR